jgi:hypothetical protein
VIGFLQGLLFISYIVGVRTKVQPLPRRKGSFGYIYFLALLSLGPRFSGLCDEMIIVMISLWLVLNHFILTLF